MKDKDIRSLHHEPDLSEISDIWDVTRLYQTFIVRALYDLHWDPTMEKSIALLDFDMIHNSMWSVLKQSDSRYDIHLGLPQSSYHFFRHGKYKFCLPDGTKHEANRILDNLFPDVRGMNRESATAYELPSNSSDLPEVNSNEAYHGFAYSSHSNIGIHDACFLSSIANHENRREPEERHLRAIRKFDIEERVRTYLGSIRPSYPNSNAADALNMAELVAGCVQERDHNYILATNTRALKGNSWSWISSRFPSHDFKESKHDKILDSRYLSFITALWQYGQGNAKPQINSLKVALVELYKVLRAQSELEAHEFILNARSNNDNYLPRKWNEFAHLREFKNWAKAYLSWRGNTISWVLDLFEHYGTTDNQLASTFEQYLKIEDVRENQPNDNSGNSKNTSNLAFIWRSMELAMRSIKPINRDLSIDWMRWLSFDIDENVAVLRLQREKPGPMIIEIAKTTGNRVIYRWTCRLSLQVLLEEIFECVQVKNEFDKVEYLAYKGFQNKILSDFPTLSNLKEFGVDVNILIMGSTWCYMIESDTKTFPDEMGIEFAVETDKYDELEILEMYFKTARYPVPSTVLSVAIIDIVKKLMEGKANETT